MKKTAPLLITIPAFILVLFPLVLGNSSLSDFTKGSVAGIFIGILLAVILVTLVQLGRINLKMNRLKKAKAKLLRFK